MSIDLVKLVEKYDKILRQLYMNGFNKQALGIKDKGSIRTCEAQILYSLIRERKYKKIIDIGTGNGFSSLYFCKALRDSEIKDAVVDTIDIVDKNIEKNIKTMFINNGLDNIIRFNVGSSDLILPGLDNDYDFVLIDGNHTYEQAKSDFYNVFDKVKPHGCFAFHDVYKKPPGSVGPRNFVEELSYNGDLDIVFFTKELFDFFIYLEDIYDCNRIAEKWKKYNYSYVSPTADPKSLMALVFKGE